MPDFTACRTLVVYLVLSGIVFTQGSIVSEEGDRLLIESRNATGLPSFVDDFHFAELEEDMPGLDMYDVIVNRRYENEDKPEICRSDICMPGTSYDYMKGRITWRKTVVGKRLYQRCPNAVNTAVYAHRDCVVVGANSTWTDPVMDICPDPPLVEATRSISKELGAIVWLSPEEQLNWRLEALSMINAALIPYPDQLIFYKNVSFIYTMFDGVLALSTGLKRRLGIQDIMKSAEILDFLWTTKRVSPRQKWSLDTMTLLCRMLYVDDHLREVTLLLAHSRLTALRIDHSTNQTLSFTVPLQNETITIDATVPVLSQITGDVIFRLVYIEDGDVYEPQVVRLYTVEIPPPRLVPLVPANHFEKTPPVTRRKRDLAETPPHVTDTYDDGVTHSVDNHTQHDDVTTIKADATTLLPPIIEHREMPPPFELMPIILRSVTLLNFHYLKGPILYALLTQPNKTSFEKDKEVLDTTLNFDYSVPKTVFAPGPYTQDCGNLQELEFGLKTEWIVHDCKPEKTSDLELSCRCNAYGYFAMFFEIFPGVIRPPIGPPAPTEKMVVKGKTFSEFLGFPFKWELYVAGHVLRAVSLLCLLLTMFSYAICREARRGVPTRILLQLCLVLVALLVTLYVTEQIAGSRLGCRVSNVLRYYLVMTSLMWNGVEAVNMYLMLIKVFNAHVPHLIWKAAAIAYGLPAVVVGIVLAVNIKNFDGFWTMECDFRCQMRDHTLYFAYLLPMSLIILFNLIVFAMVVKVLTQHKKRNIQKRKSHWIHLVGALAMLVLLGLPWIFSAFGAIDGANTSNELAVLEGIFQVVFVVFASLQGLFIFIFHCARNADIRHHWWNTVGEPFRSLTSRSTDYTFDGGSGSTNQSHSPKSTSRSSVTGTHFTTKL